MTRILVLGALFGMVACGGASHSGASGSAGSSGSASGNTGGNGGGSTSGSAGGSGNGGSGGNGGGSSNGSSNGGGMGSAGGSGAGGGGNTSGAGFSGNPFTGATFYVNPDYATEVQTSVSANPSAGTTLAKVAGYSTAIWLDSIAKTATIDKYLDDALAQQTKSGKPVITTFVVYDLPGRDCHANASNGELTLSAADVQRYHSDYIDVIAAAFAAHAGQRIAAIVEPDSLPNIATNLSDPRCAAAADIYKASVAYAIATLAAPHVALYLDAAHSGWLGWPTNTSAAATLFANVLTTAGGAQLIRGFATNTANYSVLTATTEQFDYMGNPCHDELTYVQALSSALAAVGITGKGFVIDTSRNGKGDIRAQWGSWCNVHGAALGARPVADPAAGLDAYVWVKPPGESDGTADATAARFDASCGSGNPDATPGAPQAGQWFSDYFVTLAENAVPAL